ncbi:MAG TPA: amino acid adenylation domain-containing protein, partial [Blastocatellia bacterium]|nr:amino acid adenylation domain-containing protein [Blastocatellia bacterium]
MKPEFIHHMVDRAADKFGDNVAIETAQGRMTYGELQVSSNRLANFMLDSGAEKGSIVALMGAEPLQFIIGIIAALKAGCVFVTLDPGAPENRLAAILLEAKPQLLLVGSRFIDRLDRLELYNLGSESGEAVQAPRVILLDDAPPGSPSGRLVLLGGYSRHPRTAPPAVTWAPDDMCYIFFTSGSSGKPKGIAGRIKAIDHFISWEIDTLHLGEGTRVSQLSSPSFDAVLRDIFVPLSIGGTICVPPKPNLTVDGKDLVEWLDDSAINLIHCVPSVFRLMLTQNLDPSRFSSLRHILMSGEALLPSDINKWMDTFGDRVQLINLYGPTETTMTKFCYRVTPADRERRSIPIGKPIEGAKALIVDTEGRPCRPGKVGEILIRTPFRALGYYNNPVATAEVFIRNPFNDDPDDILYRTGDFGRLMPDGNYEFLGRKDFQVKVRGVRVELGEIENALRGHESVEDVAVAVWDDTAGNNFLCAYVVLAADVSSAALRAFLAQHLPEAMLPSAFVTMETLPRTLSGKIDRRALPRPKQEAGSDGDFLEPRTPVEHIVTAIWTQLLGVKHAGLKDSFFESGGHSLLLTQLNSRLKQVFDVELPLQALLEGPNISHIAQLVESALRSGAALSRPALRPVSRNRRLPLSYAQERMWVVEQMAPGSAAYNLFAAVILSGRLSLPAIEQSLNQEIRRQESLRTAIDSTRGEPHQIVAEQAILSLGLVDLAGVDPAESRMLVHALGSERSARAFDLGQAPLMGVVLLRINPAEHVVLFAVHHIISDAWSMGILIGDVGAFYRANLMGRQPQVRDLEIQYADYAGWERDWMRGEVLEREVDYWKGALAGIAGVLELPADRERPEAQAFRGARIELAISNALAEPLEALSRREGVTLFMTLLAA